MTEQLLEKAHDRIQVICDKIKTGTLQPAKEQALEIIEEAKKEADRIRDEARKESKKLQEEQKVTLESERRLFTSSLEQAGQQAFQALKQKIETALFQPALDSWLQEQLKGAKTTARLVDVLVAAIEKEGLKTDLEARIPASISAKEALSEMAKNIAALLKDSVVELKDMKAGAKVHLKDRRMTLDLSDTALKELMASYIAKEFRKTFFAE